MIRILIPNHTHLPIPNPVIRFMLYSNHFEYLPPCSVSRHMAYHNAQPQYHPAYHNHNAHNNYNNINNALSNHNKIIKYLMGTVLSNG